MKLDDTITIHLTPHGLGVLRAKRHSGRLAVEWDAPRSTGEVRMTLRQFAHAFSEQFYVGAKNVIEENLIGLKDWRYVNINQQVEVNLTAVGKEHFEHEIYDTFSALPEDKYEKYVRSSLDTLHAAVDDRGRYETQLWHLLHVIGPHLYTDPMPAIVDDLIKVIDQ